MEGLLLIYALTISLELILSLVMGLSLFIALAPRRANQEEDRAEREDGPRRFSPSLAGALGDAFDSLSRGRDDVATLVHARHMLAVNLRDQAREGWQG